VHKVLVVDDERISLALVKFGLSEQRYEVLEANDGDVALEVLKENKPDLIVLDIQMPKMNGYEFIATLKTIEGCESIPVIVLTSNETMEDVFRLEGAKGYFVKPVNLEELVEKIKECLGPNPT